MNPTFNLLKVENATAVPLGDIPQVPIAEFIDIVSASLDKKARIGAYFAYPISRPFSSPQNHIALMIQLHGSEGGIALMRSEPLATPIIPTLSVNHPQAQYFERELAEQWGLIIENHPWMKPVRYQMPYVYWDNFADPFDRTPETKFQPCEKYFYQIDSIDTHILTLGPIRYRSDQPGHFRFQCYGEQIFFAELALGYAHRGIEKALIGGPHINTLALANTISGDHSISHTMCTVQLHEALADITPSRRGDAIRTLLLELERVKNHTLSISRVLGAVGFSAPELILLTAIQQIKNIVGLISGNRNGHNIIYPGGVSSDISESFIGASGVKIIKSLNDIDNALKIILDTPSFVRKLHCGKIDSEFCRKYGLNGLLCRSAGVANDARTMLPIGYYTEMPITTLTEDGGDTYARLMLRWREIQMSISYIIDLLINLPEDTPSSFEGDCLLFQLQLAPEHVCVTVNESSTGATAHIAITDHTGHFLQYKIIDATFRNIMALPHMLRNEYLYNFELINASLDLPFHGHDL